MAVYNRAHELARAMKESQEYREYRESRQRLDDTASRMLRDFRLHQARLHAAHLAGKEPDAEAVKQFERLRGLVELHKPLMEFLALEERLVTMIGDIQKILGDAVELWDYDLGEAKD
ncbi:MAG: YlbF family regulator [Bacillota bacterium]